MQTQRHPARAPGCPVSPRSACTSTAQAAPGLAPAQLVLVQPADWGRPRRGQRLGLPLRVAGWGDDHGRRHGRWLGRAGPGGDPRPRLLRAGRAPIWCCARRCREPAAVLPSQTPSLPGGGPPGASHPGHARRRLHRPPGRPPLDPPPGLAGPTSSRCAGTSPSPAIRRRSTPPDTDYPFLRRRAAASTRSRSGRCMPASSSRGTSASRPSARPCCSLEERLGYVHKGIEKIAEGRDPAGLARLAGRVSGDSTVGHAWAACMAMERAAGLRSAATRRSGCAR